MNKFRQRGSSIAARVVVVENVIATLITNKSDVMTRLACSAKMHSHGSEPEWPQANGQEVVDVNQTLAFPIVFGATLEHQAKSFQRGVRNEAPKMRHNENKD